MQNIDFKSKWVEEPTGPNGQMRGRWLAEVKCKKVEGVNFKKATFQSRDMMVHLMTPDDRRILFFEMHAVITQYIINKFYS